MINFLTTATHRYTVDPSARGGTLDVIDSLRLLTYEGLAAPSRLTSGCYIFSDIERLSGATRKLAVRLHDAVTRDPGSVAVNDPVRSLDRYRLLRKLESEGINWFGVRLVSEFRQLPFPMFLRHGIEHTGALTPLLGTPEEVEGAIADLTRKGTQESDLIAVEFVDVADEAGVYRKYGAFNVGGRIVPRHLLFMSDWSAKYGQLTDEAKAAEELEYVDTNPHEEELAAIFDLAEISYGRIDYAIAEGRLVIWEINTNPQLNRTPPRKPSSGSPLRARARAIGRERLRDAFAELERSATETNRRLAPRFGVADRARAGIEGFGRITGRRLAEYRLHRKLS